MVEEAWLLGGGSLSSFLLLPFPSPPLVSFSCFPPASNCQCLTWKGWVFIPNLPSHRSAWFLSAEEKERAIDRLGKPKHQKWDLTVFRRVLLSWQFYLLPFIFMRKTSRVTLKEGGTLTLRCKCIRFVCSRC